MVDPADVVCWRKRFSPQTLGLLQVLFLHRTSPDAYDLLAVVPSFWHVWRMGWTVLMWKDFLCHYHAGYVNMECLQGSHSVPNLSFPCSYYSTLLFQLSGSSSETIVDTFWWTITSSTPAQQESAGLGPVQMESCTLWDYNLQFLFPGGWLFPLHVEWGTVLCKKVESKFRC